tara:strand:- start:2166 stop:2531 length:366 start_codon:yes stop_codon:yes gene_type:complete
MRFDLFNKDNLKNSVDKILIRYPNKVPVYVKKSKNDKNLKDIEKNKFIVPNDITIGQFLTIIRKRIDLNHEMALFIFINDSILPLQSETMKNLYYEHRNSEGLLELQYCGENTFGYKIKLN